jgi:hypothetical protein
MRAGRRGDGEKCALADKDDADEALAVRSVPVVRRRQQRRMRLERLVMVVVVVVGIMLMWMVMVMVRVMIIGHARARARTAGGNSLDTTRQQLGRTPRTSDSTARSIEERLSLSC